MFERCAFAHRLNHRFVKDEDVITVDDSRVFSRHAESVGEGAVCSLVIACGHLVFDGRRCRLNLIQLGVVNQRLSTTHYSTVALVAPISTIDVWRGIT